MDHLETEARNPASTNLDELTPLEIVQLMSREDAGVLSAVASQSKSIAKAIEIITDRLRQGGRLLYVGAGTSGRLGVLDATECPPTFSSPPGQVIGLIAGGQQALTRAVEGAEDHPEFAERDLEAVHLSSRDVLVGIATSGRTPYVLGALTYARKKGTYTISLSCNSQSDLETAADLAITPVVGPEVLSGSTRLKAGTATKLILNMLSTGAMVRLGKTYGNLMVDLRATNSKLRARTNRIVRILTGLSTEEADELLQRCGGELKTALVVQQTGLSPPDARLRLEQAGGQVRKALHESARLEAVIPEPSPNGDLYLGIDGGGSHTVALLGTGAGGPLSTNCPKGTILGRGTSGPSNLQAVGPAKALAALDEAIAKAFVAAKLNRAPVAVACLGLAGAGRAQDRQMLVDWSGLVGLAKKVEIATDAELLLAAGTPYGWGLAVVAGTGSIAFGRTADGRSARSGGWGYLLGDEGSGYALVMAGLQAMVRAADERGAPTALTKRFLASLGLSQPQELIPKIYGGAWERAELAGLAPLVLEWAQAGDSVAKTIVKEAAEALALTAASVAKKLALDRSPLDLALAGGLLVQSEPYRIQFLEALSAEGVRSERISLVTEPAVGAVHLALLHRDRLPV